MFNIFQNYKKTDGMIDPCAKSPCGNNGECDDKIDSYTCRCQPDYTGINCETQIDDCYGIICHNNGTCVDDVNKYTCNCVIGFRDMHCGMVDECFSEPCFN